MILRERNYSIGREICRHRVRIAWSEDVTKEELDIEVQPTISLLREVMRKKFRTETVWTYSM